MKHTKAAVELGKKNRLNDANNSNPLCAEVCAFRHNKFFFHIYFICTFECPYRQKKIEMG